MLSATYHIGLFWGVIETTHPSPQYQFLPFLRSFGLFLRWARRSLTFSTFRYLEVPEIDIEKLVARQAFFRTSHEQLPVLGYEAIELYTQ
jgi:hypothetical protein